MRGHTAWAIGEIGAPDSNALLIAARSDETDPDVLNEIDAALSRLEQSTTPPLPRQVEGLGGERALEHKHVKNAAELR